MRLIALQRQFLQSVSQPGDADDSGWPAPLHAGLQVYRNAYRARLMGCLQSSFPKSRAWAGDASFDAAASHHCIRRPPSSWTLDALGAAFDDTLAELFPDNPELAELGWLEWQMATLFTAADGARLDAASFADATAGFAEADWGALRLVIAPELVSRIVAYDVPALWSALSADTAQALIAPAPLAAPATLAVWRVGLEPCFRLLAKDEAAALAQAADGASFDQICTLHADSTGGADTARLCGQWLGGWITGGLVAAIRS